MAPQIIKYKDYVNCKINNRDFHYWAHQVVMSLPETSSKKKILVIGSNEELLIKVVFEKGKVSAIAEWNYQDSLTDKLKVATSWKDTPWLNTAFFLNVDHFEYDERFDNLPMADGSEITLKALRVIVDDFISELDINSIDCIVVAGNLASFNPLLYELQETKSCSVYGIKTMSGVSSKREPIHYTVPLSESMLDTNYCEGITWRDILPDFRPDYSVGDVNFKYADIHSEVDCFNNTFFYVTGSDAICKGTLYSKEVHVNNLLSVYKTEGTIEKECQIEIDSSQHDYNNAEVVVKNAIAPPVIPSENQNNNEQEVIQKITEGTQCQDIVKEEIDTSEIGSVSAAIAQEAHLRYNKNYKQIGKKGVLLFTKEQLDNSSDELLVEQWKRLIDMIDYDILITDTNIWLWVRKRKSNVMQKDGTTKDIITMSNENMLKYFGQFLKNRHGHIELHGKAYHEIDHFSKNEGNREYSDIVYTRHTRVYENQDKHSLQSNAKKSKILIEQLLQKNELIIPDLKPEEEDRYADPCIIQQFKDWLNKSQKVLLVSNDRALRTQCLQSLNECVGVENKDVCDGITVSYVVSQITYIENKINKKQSK